MNRDRVGWALEPEGIDESTKANKLESTTEDFTEKNREGERWFVKSVVDH